MAGKARRRPGLACARAQKQITVQEHVLISSNLKRDAIFGLHETERLRTKDVTRQRSSRKRHAEWQRGAELMAAAGELNKRLPFKQVNRVPAQVR